jgi:anti-sigma regulatory factor (Ser/Thr protein kinase)
MQVTCSLGSNRIVIRVRDWGRSFEPALVAEPDITAPLEERDLGGLGLFLIRRLMDDVQYTFDPQKGNEVLMVKHLSGEREGLEEP